MHLNDVYVSAHAHLLRKRRVVRRVCPGMGITPEAHVREVYSREFLLCVCVSARGNLSVVDQDLIEAQKVKRVN